MVVADRIGHIQPVRPYLVRRIRPGEHCPVVVVGEDIEIPFHKRTIEIIEFGDSLLPAILQGIDFCIVDKFEEIHVNKALFGRIHPGPDPVRVINRADIADLERALLVAGRIRVAVEDIPAPCLCQLDLDPGIQFS
ncbi:MAG: hypothetical protein A4E42_00637 [Methanoregulaceae archaeon PtaU1.Bin222]|nr:MAG: hypothetical protein A4E42_00637 [Methanoregulaceae archaeon PtaU1.Bin222]